MKNLLIAFGLIAFMSACGGDDDSIEGTWNLVSGETTDCDDPSFNVSLTAGGDCAIFCIEEELTIGDGEFTTVTTTGFGGNIDVETTTGTYTIDGDRITTCFDGDCESAIFDVDGDVLSFVIAADADGCNSTSTYSKG